MTPILETPRLLLKPASLDDCAALQPLFADWEIVKYMVASIPWPNPDDGVYAYTRDFVLPDMQAGKSHVWTLVERASGASMGRIDLNVGQIDFDKDEHRGYWIGRKFQRNGYMSEAMAATANYAFDVLGMPLLISRVAEPNNGSNSLQQISGAQIAHTAESDYGAGRLSTNIWHLTPDAWRASPLKQKYG